MATQTPASTLVDDLTRIIPADRVSVSAADRDQHSRDQSAHPAHLPDAVVWVQSTQEVSDILQYANARGIPVTAWGAGTSIEGNPIPVRGGIVLDFQQMDKILEIHQSDFQVTVQPGVLYKDMNKILARHGLFFAPDPGANASIGGMLANNAAGIRTVKYGATRENTLALEVVLADGTVIHTGSRSVKQSAGYDLTHLFVGSEGTLGIITAATLKLAPLPEHFSVATAAFPDVAHAAHAVSELIGAGLEPTALELLDATAIRVMNTDEGISFPETPHLFMEFNGVNDDALAQTLALAEEICRENAAETYQSGIGRAARAKLWEARHRIFEVHVRYFAGQDFFVADAAVPISNYPALAAAAEEWLSELKVDGSVLGHAGDGNLHVLGFYPPDDAEKREKARQLNQRLVELALKLDGTSTGEHGVGMGKRKYMVKEHGAAAIGVMRQLKNLLDPNGILNPGKVLDD